MKNNKKSKDKFCTRCKNLLNENNSRESDIKNYYYICIICQKDIKNKYCKDNKEKICIYKKIYDRNQKQIVVDNYGGKCNCCGESKIEFLTIDHVNNNGAEDRKLHKDKTGSGMYRWLIKNNFPKDNYQLLCFNCNCAKGFYGVCPHQKLKI